MPKKRCPRILLVDSPDFVARIRKPLEEAGYWGWGCSTGKEGLFFLERGKIDLIILDLTLPVGEMTGYDMCLRIKQDSRLKSISVILLCDPRIPIGVRMDYRFELEASTLLVKPVDMDRLCLEIKSLMTLS